MAVSAAQFTVTTSAVRLDTGGSDSIYGHRLLIRNTDATNAVFLGPSNVTTATGFSLAAGQTLEVSLNESDTLYAISAGSVVVGVLRVG